MRNYSLDVDIYFSMWVKEINERKSDDVFGKSLEMMKKNIG